MFDLILDLLPDEPGEVLGFTFFTGATIYYINSINEDLRKQESRYSNLSNITQREISKLKEELERNTLSESARNYVRDNF
jgi:hypothetical protein